LFVKIIYRLFNGDVSFASVNARLKLLGSYVVIRYWRR